MELDLLDTEANAGAPSPFFTATEEGTRRRTFRAASPLRKTLKAGRWTFLSGRGQTRAAQVFSPKLGLVSPSRAPAADKNTFGLMRFLPDGGGGRPEGKEESA